MQLSTASGGKRSFILNLAGSTKNVVRSKNTGQSFFVRGHDQDTVMLVPIQGEDYLVPKESFTTDSWEVVH